MMSSPNPCLQEGFSLADALHLSELPGTLLALALLIGWGRWVRLEGWAWLALGLKLIGAALVSGMYLCYYGEGDLLAYASTLRTLGTCLIEHPREGFALLLPELWPQAAQTAYQAVGEANGLPYFHHPEAYRFVRLILPLYGLTGGSLGGTTILLAGGAFSGLRALAYAWMEAAEGRGAWTFRVICFGLPTMWIWSSGLLKDTLTVMFMAWGLVGWYRLGSGKRNVHPPYGPVAWTVSCWLGVGLLKPYLSAAWLPLLMLWASGRLPPRWPLTTRLGIRLALLGLCLAGGMLSPYPPAYILKQSLSLHYVLRHAEEQTHPDRPPAYTMPVRKPDPGIYFRSLPVLWATAFFRPGVWEVAGRPLLWLWALENLAVMGAAGVWLIQIVRGRGGRAWLQTPALWALLPFALVYGALTALSVPVFGSLLRYRVYYLPFLLAGLKLWAVRAASGAGTTTCVQPDQSSGKSETGAESDTANQGQWSRR